METFRILVINPGSTSTKIGVYENEKLIFDDTLRHDVDDLSKYDKMIDQFQFRKDIIVDSLKKNNIKIDSLAAVVGRGGLLNPIEGGTYEVNDRMLEDLRAAKRGEH